METDGSPQTLHLDKSGFHGLIFTFMVLNPSGATAFAGETISVAAVPAAAVLLREAAWSSLVPIAAEV